MNRFTTSAVHSFAQRVLHFLLEEYIEASFEFGTFDFREWFGANLFFEFFDSEAEDCLFKSVS